MSWFMLAISVGLTAAPGEPPPKHVREAETLPRLVLVANSTTILQRDPLFLMSLVENKSGTDIRLFHEPKQTGDYAILYLRAKDEWRRIPTMAEIRSPRKDLEGPENGRAVLSHSTYAEFHAIHREGDAFLFEETGTYELRAVVETSAGTWTSKSVTVTVQPRPAKDLERIATAAKQLHYLEFYTLQWKPPDEIKALKDVGGNTGMAIKNALLLQEIARSGTVKGLHVSKGEIIEVLTQLDPVSRNNAFDQLAENFRRKGEHKTFKAIIEASPHDSQRRRESLRKFRLLNDPTALEWWVRRDFGELSDEKVDSE